MSTTKLAKKVIRAAVLAASLGLATTRANAATYSWTGGGGSLNTGWNVTGNWTGGVKPVAADDSVVVFGPGAGDNFQDISIPLIAHEIQFAPGSSDNVGGFPLDLRGNVNAPTGFIHTYSDLTNTVSNNLTVGSYLYVMGNSGSGPVILNGNIGGAGKIGCANRGVLRLAGNNTFGGGVDLSYGDELQVTNSNSLGTGTLYMDASTSIRAYGAPVTLPNAFNFYNVGTYSFVGDKDITFTGPTAVTGGGPKYFDVAPGITARFNGVVSGNPLAVPLNKTGDGTLTLAANSTFAGSLNVAAGTLALGAQDALPANADVTVQSGAALNIGSCGNGSTIAPTKAIHSLTLNGGQLRVPNSAGDYWLNQLNFTGGNIDMTGSVAFWLHFTGATPKLTVNPSDQTAVIGGGSSCQLRNDSADPVVMNVGAGTTASGIDLDVSATLLSIGGKFEKHGGGTMRLSNTTTGGNGYLSIQGGTVRFDDPKALPTGTIDLAGGALQYGGTGSVSTTAKPNVYGGTIDIRSSQATADFSNGFGVSGTLYKTGPGTLELPNLRLFVLHLNEGKVRITPNGTATGTGKNTSTWMTPGTQLDVTNNDLVMDSNGANNFGDTVALIKSGYANGSWTGPGITSSSAAASSGHRALGVVMASDLFASFPATFSGQTVAATDILVKYTVTGDANLDGKVDLTDFTYLAANFNGTGKDWLHGDYNYDGTVDLTDFTFLASNFNQTLPAGGASPEAIGTPTPEPASVSVMSIVLAAVASRRARRRRV